MKTYQNFINGTFIPSAGDDALEVTNPATGAVVSRVPESTEEDLARALDAADAHRPAARGKMPFEPVAMHIDDARKHAKAAQVH